jgi:O-succinylbenzoate synthase
LTAFAQWLAAVDVHVVALPMTTRFRGITVREAALLHGEGGWGEFAPFLDYSPAEAAPWLAAAYEAATAAPPPALRDAIPVNVTVPAVDPEAAAAIVRAGAGCKTAKVKVAERGQSLDEDVARVASVFAALGPGGVVRVDANGAWSVDEAVAAIAALEAVGPLEYVEQPCRTIDELAAVRRQVGAPIAADESIRRAEDPMRVAVAGAADIAVIKVAPLGGMRRALQVAEACGLPCVVSSAVDTSVGLAAGIALAAALPELPHACGLATGKLLGADIVVDRLLPIDGMVPTRPVEPDPALLAEHAAPPDRRAWWLNHIAATAEHVTADQVSAPTGGQR